MDRDCWPAVVVFIRLQNQWERSDFDNSYRCLPIERITAYLDVCRNDWTVRQRAQVVDDLLIMEDEAVIAFAERAQQQKENAQQPPMMTHG